MSMLVERVCQQCDATFNVKAFRLHQGRGRYCSRTCRQAAQVTRMQRLCQRCGRSFEVNPWKIAHGYGRYCSRECTLRVATAAARVANRVAPRSGDAKQARQWVRKAIDRGAVPRPNTLPCTDCSHIWHDGEPRHEYDHYLGYTADHHGDVEAVCSRCHRRRSIARANRWLAWVEA